jgi:hypothetical protein
VQKKKKMKEKEKKRKEDVLLGLVIHLMPHQRAVYSVLPAAASIPSSTPREPPAPRSPPPRRTCSPDAAAGSRVSAFPRQPWGPESTAEQNNNGKLGKLEKGKDKKPGNNIEDVVL